MHKYRLIATFALMLTLPLSACGEKQPISPAPVSSETASNPSNTLSPEPVITPEPAGTLTSSGLENTDAADLGKTIESYNSEVDGSNDKARDIIDAYNGKIDAATGK